ncbi:MAG: hypothetical protein ACPG4T_20495, partial [Nannocystaceae bacterium]
MTLEELERKFDRQIKEKDDAAKVYAVVTGIAAYVAAVFTLKPKEEDKKAVAEKTEEAPTQ